MRRNLRILFLILFLGPLSLKAQPENYKEPGSSLPELRLKTRHGEIRTPLAEATERPIMVFMFNPTCDHCQQVAREMKERKMDTLGPVIWLASSQMPLGHLEFFNSVTRIDSTKMMMGIDQSGFIDKSFIYEGLPQLNLYSADKILLRQYPGNIPLDSLVLFYEKKEGVIPEESGMENPGE